MAGGATVEARSLGPVSVAARAFRRRGRTFVSAIVKATCTLAQDAAMAIAKPTAIQWADQLRSSSPVASARRTSDCAPFLARPEIILDAIAFSAGPPLPRLTTRLAVARGTEMLVSKHLEIVGDRRIPADGPGPNPAAFQHMPIEYERAFGGLGRPENPAGMGQVEADGSARVPNVRAGEGSSADPPGYGPIPATWPHRRAKRGSHAGDGLEPGFVDLEDDLADDYYQASPADQRVDAWRPGDLIVLVNMHPTFLTLRVTLPTMFGVALVVDRHGRREPVELTADTVFIEPHAMRADILFRGAIPVADPTAARVFGAIRGVEPFEWPADLEEAGARAAPPGVATAPRYGVEGTLVMEREAGAHDGRKGHGTTLVLESPGTGADHTITREVPAGAARPSTPFAPRSTRARPRDAIATGTPWTPERKIPAPPVDGPMSTTLVAAVPRPVAEITEERTDVLDPTTLDEPTDAMDRGPEAQRAGAAAASVTPAPPPPAPTPPPTAPTPPPTTPTPTAPTPPPTTPTPTEPPARRKAVWRDDPAPAPAPAPTAAPPEPRADARDKLYKKFK